MDSPKLDVEEDIHFSQDSIKVDEAIQEIPVIPEETIKDREDKEEKNDDFFTKTLALSCQKDRKNKYKYACGLMTKQTLTHPRK